MNLKNLFTQPLQLIPSWLPIAALIASLGGFADATYITVKHFQGVIPPCSIGGCETVLASAYSQIFGLPVSLLGAIYYFIIILSLFIYLDSKKEIFLRIPLMLSIVGFIFSLYFVSLMIFVIKAFCLYCAVSALTSTIVFVLAVYIRYKNYGRL